MKYYTATKINEDEIYYSMSTEPFKNNFRTEGEWWTIGYFDEELSVWKRFTLNEEYGTVLLPKSWEMI